MKKLIIIIFILIANITFAQDTIKIFTKVINFGKSDTKIYKCYVIKNSSEEPDTVCNLIPQAQAKKDRVVYICSARALDTMVRIIKADKDTTETIKEMVELKTKIETDYKNDLKQFQELQTKMIKEESYLEILNYLIEEEKKK